jgi:hypothetical protein
MPLGGCVLSWAAIMLLIDFIRHHHAHTFCLSCEHELIDIIKYRDHSIQMITSKAPSGPLYRN